MSIEKQQLAALEIIRRIDNLPRGKTDNLHTVLEDDFTKITAATIQQLIDGVETDSKSITIKDANLKILRKALDALDVTTP